jgi:tetratricopeptide (TPR) repeat protein
MGNSMDNIANLEEILANCENVLAKLEARKALFTVSTFPINSQIDLEEKQKEVNLVKEKLEAAKSAKRGTHLAKEDNQAGKYDTQGDKTKEPEPTNKDYLAFHLFECLNLYVDDYRFLCRLGCYLYEDIPTLNQESILSLFWDISQELNPIEIIDSLRNRFLIDHNGYSLHPEIYSEARRRLESSPEEWNDVNTQVAKFYSGKADFYSDNVIGITDKAQVEAAFKAINHYDNAEEFEKCREMLMHILGATENLSNLRCSDNLWSHSSRIVKICEKLTGENGLQGFDKALILIPLGVLYPEIGKSNQAIEVSKDIICIAEDLLDEENSNNQKIILAKVSAHLISGRANRIIGNFSDALHACKEALKSVKFTRITHVNRDKIITKYWEALALYELGTVHLEVSKINELFSEETYAEAEKALLLIVRSAFLATGIGIPGKFIKFFTRLTEIQSNTKIILEEIENQTDKLKSNDRTTQFRILHNVGKCIRLMGYTSVGHMFLEKARKCLLKTDDLNQTWSQLEIALCLPLNEAQKCYNTAKGKYSVLPTICKAHFLLEHGRFMCKRKHYIKAIEEYLKLEKLLEHTEFESLKALNYYSICLAYSELDDAEKIIIHSEVTEKRIFTYLQKSAEICEELGLLDVDKIQELRTTIQSKSTPQEV